MEDIRGVRLRKFKLRKIILGVRMHFRHSSIKPKSQYPSLHQKFGDIINDNGLAQIVQEPTRQGNVLDLIVTNKPNQVKRVQILPGIGDHNAVFCDLM